MSQPLQAEPIRPPTDQPPVVVKKYANRRLYNTESSSYITLDTLAEMVRLGRDFVVYDAKTGDDITRSVLTQIIVEEESKGRAMLPTGFLRQLIGFYGDSVQTLVPRYLEQAMTSFARQQEQMRVAMQQTMGNFFPFGMEEVGRQNLAMMERAMSLFSPFTRSTDLSEGRQPAPTPPPIPPLQDEVKALRAEVEFLRSQLSRVRATQQSDGRAADMQVIDGAVQTLPKMDTTVD
jgi:polyhydroxyalkanoate synthesis repressor PhaR